MTGVISARLRRLVVERAFGLCEYCLIHQANAHFTFPIDHIISRKQGGGTMSANLALACLRCNVTKGTDPAAYIGHPPKLVRLYHPREDRWSDHFQLVGARITPLTDVGLATVQLLKLNTNDRLQLRRALVRAGQYPTLQALAYLRD